MSLFKNPIVLDLLAKYKPIAAMAHTSALLGWDLEILAKTLSQGRFPDKHSIEDLDYDVEALKQVNEKLIGMIYPMRKTKRPVQIACAP